VLLLPGTVFDQPRHIRFGYGRRNFPEALAQFESWLSARAVLGPALASDGMP
jgi:hypothetical protein